MVKYGSSVIQAFPVHRDTFIGIASNYTGSRRIVHAVKDGKVTFRFIDGVEKEFDAVSGQDFAVPVDVESITSTATVWIS